MADHYNNITVSSNVDTFREFPENTQSNFKVPLTRPLHLTGMWEACVKEVFPTSYKMWGRTLERFTSCTDTRF